MAAGAKLTGRQEMKAKLSTVVGNYNDRVGKALYAEMGIEEAEVIKRTPKESGDLRSTVHRIGPRQEGKTISVIIVAGGPDAPYAIVVHEDLEAIHQVGQAKYLESVILESRQYISPRVAHRLDISGWVS